MRLLALILCLVTFAPHGAEAGKRRNRTLVREAKRHTRIGMAHFKKGRMDRAIESLQIAYSLDPRPALLYYIAEAHNAKKEYPQALYHYQQYREKDPRGARKRGVDAVIDALAAMPEVAPPQVAAAAAAAPPEEAAAGADEEGAAEAAATAPATAAPAPVAPAAQPLASAPAVSRSVDAPDPTAGRGKRISGLVTMAAGLTLAGAGGYYALVARDRAQEISDVFEEGGAWKSSYDDKYDEGRSARTRAFVLAGAGGVAIATGAVLYWLGRRDRARSERRIEVVAAPVRGGGEVVFQWSH